jgi:hypothetical protein
MSSRTPRWIPLFYTICHKLIFAWRAGCIKNSNCQLYKIFVYNVLRVGRYRQRHKMLSSSKETAIIGHRESKFYFMILNDNFIENFLRNSFRDSAKFLESVELLRPPPHKIFYLFSPFHLRSLRFWTPRTLRLWVLILPRAWFYIRVLLSMHMPCDELVTRQSGTPNFLRIHSLRTNYEGPNPWGLYCTMIRKRAQDIQCPFILALNVLLNLDMYIDKI